MKRDITQPINNQHTNFCGGSLRLFNFILKSSPLLIVFSIILIFLAFYTPLIYLKLTGNFYDFHHIGSMIFFVVYTLFCYLTLPLLLNRILYHMKLSDLGLVLPKNNFNTYLLICCSLALTLPCIIYISNTTQVHHYYSLGNISLIKLVFLQLIILPLYYFAEEFFFRGFLFVILWEKLGWHSFWISDIIFTFAHAYKPMFEILLAIPVSVILNFLVLKTKSIFPGMLVHYMMGFTLLIFTNYIN